LNLFSKNASFEDVQKDPEAMRYHAVKFQTGHRYALALLCFHAVKEEENAKNSES
jgi:hypothetical protein